jgi:hypothetical protein
VISLIYIGECVFTKSDTLVIIALCLDKWFADSSTGVWSTGEWLLTRLKKSLVRLTILIKTIIDLQYINNII